MKLQKSKLRKQEEACGHPVTQGSLSIQTFLIFSSKGDKSQEQEHTNSPLPLCSPEESRAPEISPEEDVNPVNVSAEEANGMGHLRGNVLETEEVIWHLGRPSHFTGPVQAQHQQVHHKPIVLDNEGSKLQPTNNPVGVCVIHVLRR